MNHFFPSPKPHHRQEIEEQIRNSCFLDPSILSYEDYERATEVGVRVARDYLFRLPSDVRVINHQTIALLHGLLFNGVYNFAGLFREESEVVRFGNELSPRRHILSRELELLDNQTDCIVASWDSLQDDRERLHDKLRFIAFYHLRFTLLHPFLDGNGRLSRMIALWQEWALLGPHELTTPSRETYMDALKCSDTDIRKMMNFFCTRNGLDFTHTVPLRPPYPISITSARTR